MELAVATITETIFLDTYLPYTHERGVSIINLIAIRTKTKIFQIYSLAHSQLQITIITFYFSKANY